MGVGFDLERRLELRRDTLERAGGSRSQRRRRKAAATALTAEGADADPAAETLFEALRAKRAELAAEQGVPPYVIFHDKALAAMAVHRPLDEETFLRIGGVGQKKLERYGEIFMAVIRESAD